MSLKDVKTMLDKNRLVVQGIISRKVSIKSVDNNNNKKLFNSIANCIAYLNDPFKQNYSL